MTGVAAVMPRGGGDAPSDVLRRLLAALMHRGGSVESVTVDRAVLGGCHHGSSPVARRGSLAVSADVRLDEAAELGEQLGLSAGATDAELVLAAYQRWGARCVDHLRGDFAFVVLDGHRQRMFCARDPLGARPLYYRDGGARFSCASEPAALLADPDAGRRANLTQVAMLLGGLYSEADATVFEGVRALPGGHCLLVSRQGVRKERFWAPDPWRRLEVDDAEAAHLVREAVGRAVRRRARGAERLAIYLSGGLDSAAVAAEVARSEPRPGARVIHAAFPGSDEDETPFSDAVADMWGLPTVNARALDAVGYMSPTLERSPDLLWDPRVGLWEYLYGESKKMGVDVALTGEGGDYCLRGTGTEWADALRSGRLARVARDSNLHRRPWSRSRWGRLLREALLPLLPSPIPEMARRRSSGGLTPTFAKRVEEEGRDRARRRASRAYPDLVTRALCGALEDGDNLLMVSLTDRISARAGIDLRHGLLDLDLLELLLALPHEQRHVVGRDKPKPVLRRAMQGSLPPEVLDRRSSGCYTYLFREVLFRHHRDAIRALFGSSRLQEAGIIDAATARRLAEGEPLPAEGASAGSLLVQRSNLVAMETLLRQL